MRHSNIKVIDFSWNSLGTFKGKVFANQLAEVLTTQENLLHLDISHNKFKPEDCRTISCALATNHNLWGIHMLGNGTYAVDAKGFLHEESFSTSIGTGHLESRINGVRMVVANTEREATKIKRINNCWICEGWNEMLIEWPRGNVYFTYIVAGNNEPVYLNLECDNYFPDLMYTETGFSGLIQWRMCPPGRIRFFFTSEGKAKVSNKYPIMKYSLRMKVSEGIANFR